MNNVSHLPLDDRLDALYSRNSIDDAPYFASIEASNTDAQKHGRPKFRFKRAGEMTEKPVPVNWLIKGLLTKENLGMVFGPPANCKSLFVLDAAFCIAAGIDYEGRKTDQGDVVIIAGEGFYGYCLRLKALEDKYRMMSPMNLVISEQAAQLEDMASCDDVAQAIRESGLNPKLIIIDTLNRNFCADENSSKDIAQLMANIEKFFKPFGATIIIVHHSGHDKNDRARGSSAIRGALDFEYGVIKDDSNNVTIENYKAKDFEPPKPLNFVMKSARLNWLDDDGEQQTSVYLEYTGEAIKKPKKPQLKPHEQQILQSLTDALREKGVEPTAEIQKKYTIIGTGTFAKVVNLEDWRQYAYKHISEDSSNKRRDFQRIREKFCKYELMIEYDGFVWRIDQASKNSSVPNQENDSKNPDVAIDSNNKGVPNIKNTLEASNDKALSDTVPKRTKNEIGTGCESVPTVPPPYKGGTVGTDTFQFGFADEFDSYDGADIEVFEDEPYIEDDSDEEGF